MHAYAYACTVRAHTHTVGRVFHPQYCMYMVRTVAWLGWIGLGL